MELSLQSSLFPEAKRVFIHARWPVQSYVLLGFLFSAVLTRHPIDGAYVVALVAWLSIVVGLTVLNAYYDKDESPVGGMQNPPKVNRSLLHGARLLLGFGLLVGLPFGATFWGLMLAVVVLYYFYSHEATRWKQNGYVAIAINAVVGGLTVLGAATLGSRVSAPEVVLGALCAGAFKASVYSMMQVHQIEEDSERGDHSFAIMHGRATTLRFSQAMLLLAGVFAVGATLVMGIGPALSALTAAYFLTGLALFEIWIRKNADPRLDSLRMQRMIAYTGYFGTCAFLAVYVTMTLLGLMNPA